MKSSFFKSLKIIIVLFLSFPSWSLPYQANCSDDQKDRTSQFAPSSTEADFCFECEYQNANGALIKLQNLDVILYDVIPKECFLAIATRGHHIFGERYIYCSSENNSSHLEGSDQKFCINEDYITSLYQAFNKMAYCFDFDKKTQEDLFYMINRESGGILNSKSETEARCLGQITKTYTENINNIIESLERKNPHKESFIWKDVLERCPDLEDSQISMATLNCESTQNPEKCLLYSFFGKKRSYYSIQERLDSPMDFMGDNREFPSAEELAEELAKKKINLDSEGKQKYEDMLKLFPMKGREILILRASLQDGRKIRFVMWAPSEIYDSNLHTKIDWSQEVDIRKVNLFENEEDIKAMFMYWSHNGGESLSRPGFIKRLKKLKQDIASGGCGKNSQELRCQMRRNLDNGGQVTNNQALQYFERNLKQTYPSRNKNRRREVSEYVRKIIESRSQVFETTPGTKNNNLMLEYFKNNAIPEEKAQAFIKHADEICPQTLDITEPDSS